MFVVCFREMSDNVLNTEGSHLTKATKNTSSPNARQMRIRTPASHGNCNQRRTTPAKRRRSSNKAIKAEEEKATEQTLDQNTKKEEVAQSWIDDLSSDSSLSDPPSDLDLESDIESPYFSQPSTPIKASKVKPVKVRRPTISPYFPRQPVKRITCLPFPPLESTRFGLMQERLAHDPFRMLVATIFLNKTRGEQAMPVYFHLMSKYPTVESLANANVEDITRIIHSLGFQNSRARKCVELANAWLSHPPEKDRRYRKLNYPSRGDGRDVQPEETLSDHDQRVAWEIAHLPGLGAYALDSWRIFCRDKLRGLSSSWNGESSQITEFEPEWKRVVPTDKELRAYLTWMWLKLGYVWNKETGARTVADQGTLARAKEGGVVHDDGQYLILTTMPPKDDLMRNGERVKTTV